MAIFSVRVARGLRFSLTPRGVRAHIGPRHARIHVGAGRTGVSTGTGPFGVYLPISTGNSARSRTTERERRADHAAGLAEQIAELTGAHRTVFIPAQRPELEPVTEDRDIWCDSYADAAVAHLPRWRIWRRHRLRTRTRRAAENAWPAHVKARNRQVEVHHKHRVEAWEKLVANDERTVVDTVTVALADNDLRAVAAGVHDNQVTLLVAAPDLADIPVDEPAQTTTGQSTVRPLSQTRRNDLHAATVISHTLAAVNETFAVAPGIDWVVAVAVNTNRDIVLALRINRDAAGHVTRTDDPFEALTFADQAELGRKGRTRTLARIDRLHAGDTQTLIDAIDTDRTDPDDRRMTDELAALDELDVPGNQPGS